MELKRTFNVKTLHTDVGPDDAAKPLCPHREQPLAQLVSHRSDCVGLANMHVFSCPSCRKAIGIATPSK